MMRISRFNHVVIVSLTMMLVSQASLGADAIDQANRVYELSGVTGGFVVQVGLGDGDFAAARR